MVYKNDNSGFLTFLLSYFTLWNILMILDRNVEQDENMCDV